MRCGHLGADLANAVAAKLQRTAGGDLRVQLTQTAGRRIARVRKGFATALRLTGIQRLKARFGHKHFTAHLKHLRPALALQLERYIADGAHVAGDVFTGTAITTRGTTNQQAVLVTQADSQSIKFRLAAVMNFGTAAKQITALHAQTGLNAAIKRAQVLFFKCVTQTQHGHFMAHFTEGTECLSPDTLRGRLRSNQLRVLRLERLQFTKQSVVFRVGDAGFIQHVIAVVVRVEFCTQLLDALGGWQVCGHGGIS